MKKITALFLAFVLSFAPASFCFCEEPGSASAPEGFRMEFDNPQCIAETEDIYVYVNSIEVDDSEYLILDTLVKNLSEETEYEVSVRRAAVNSIELYPTYSEYISDECDEPIAMDLSNALEFAVIRAITDIELEINIEDDDLECVLNQTVHIYPYGEQKAVRYERTPADTDILLVSNDCLAICVTGCEYVEGWGYSVHLFIQNRMNEDICVEGDYYTINDVSVGTWYDDVVGAGDVSFSHVEWSRGDLDDAGITEVRKLGFILRVYDKTMDHLIFDKEVYLEP